MEISTAPFALAVDDEPIIRMDAAQILEEAGYRCLEAESGEEAINILTEKGQQVVVLFTDVEMPGSVNGFALACYVAEHWPHIEIVVSSGRVKPDAADLPVKAAFIMKPFSADTIHGELRRLLPGGTKPAPLKTAV